MGADDNIYFKIPSHWSLGDGTHLQDMRNPDVHEAW